MFDNVDFTKPQYYTLAEFEFNSGDILKDVDVEYITAGTPEYDEKGHIINGLIYCHGWSGDFGSLRRIQEVSGEDEILDTNKFFIICLSTLGSPRSLSPSMTNLKGNFPQYTIKDMVNFQIAFLSDKFNIQHVKGLIGNSMGGFEVLTWAAIYPDFMDFVISLVSSYKVAGHNYAQSRQMNDIIESDPDYNNGNYIESDSLTRTFKLAIESMYCYGFSRQHYRDMTNIEIDEDMKNMVEEESLDDINDIVYRNNAMLNYDIEDILSNIKAKILIVAINQDQYFPPELDAIPMSKMIINSDLVIYDSVNGHIGSKELIKIKDKLTSFLDDV